MMPGTSEGEIDPVCGMMVGIEEARAGCPGRRFRAVAGPAVGDQTCDHPGSFRRLSCARLLSIGSRRPLDVVGEGDTTRI